jgi:hypothetical protein
VLAVVDPDDFGVVLSPGMEEKRISKLRCAVASCEEQDGG